MKGLFIVTGTNEVHKHYESFAAIGHDVACYVYNHKKDPGASAAGARLDAEIYEAARRYGPDLIVYVGACGGNTPSAAGFAKLRAEVAPTVHFCSDAADDPWWPFLIEYDKAGAFDLQVALDGSRAWPLAATQLTALTVIDPARFPAIPLPHAARPIAFGFAGNYGVGKPRKNRAIGARQMKVEAMARFGLQSRTRDQGVESYRDYVKFMSRCRIVVNFPQTGTARFMHVKGRVVEAGLAGAALLEERGSPTSHWFEPGIDYLEYGSVDEVRRIVSRLRGLPAETEAMGARLRAKVLAEHGPDKFWGRIFERLGLAVPA